MSDADQDIEENIRMRAYLLWELEGRQEGKADHYWQCARELIESKSHSADPSPGAIKGEPELVSCPSNTG
jgi:hypothetical protein